MAGLREWLAVAVRCSAPHDIRAAESIGITAVLEQAKDDPAKAFTLAQAEFHEFPAGRRTL